MTTSAPTRFSWAVTLRGAMGIVLALLAFGMPLVTGAILAGALAGYALVDGILALICASSARIHDMSSLPFVVEGLLGLIVGAIALGARVVAPLVVLPLIAAWSSSAGVCRVAAAVHIHRRAHEWLLALTGAVGVALGLVIIQYPDAGPDSTMSAMGAYAGIVGVMLGAWGIRLRRLATPVPA